MKVTVREPAFSAVPAFLIASRLQGRGRAREQQNIRIHSSDTSIGAGDDARDGKASGFKSTAGFKFMYAQ